MVTGATYSMRGESRGLGEELSCPVACGDELERSTMCLEKMEEGMPERRRLYRDRGQEDTACSRNESKPGVAVAPLRGW